MTGSVPDRAPPRPGDSGFVRLHSHDGDPTPLRDRLVTLLFVAALAAGAFTLGFDFTVFWSQRPVFAEAAFATTVLAAPLALAAALISTAAGRPHAWTLFAAAAIFVANLTHRTMEGVTGAGSGYWMGIGMTILGNLALGAFAIRGFDADADVADPLAREWFDGDE